MSKKLSMILIGALAVMAGSSVGYGAIINLKSGSLDFLKGETQVNVEYSYDGMRVSKFATEQEYLDKKTAEYNAKEAWPRRPLAPSLGRRPRAAIPAQVRGTSQPLSDRSQEQPEVWQLQRCEIHSPFEDNLH